MSRPHEIVFLTIDGAQLLDLAGPASVFANANICQQTVQYTLRYASLNGDLIGTECGLPIGTEALSSLAVADIDTLVVIAGPEASLTAALKNPELMAWLKMHGSAVPRLASVCTGAFMLAEAGLLDGLEATTHWQACGPMEDRYPEIAVNDTALFIQQGNIWTSAGVSTGIDMALAMVEHDLGGATSHQIAQNLVLYSRRPGHQTQFSDMLRLQEQSATRFGTLLEWITANLDASLTTTDLADYMGMSERHFFRSFKAEIGMAPATYLRQQRLEKARLLLLAGETVKRIAGQAGFSSPANFGTAFKSRFGLTPALYREMHGPNEVSTGRLQP